MKTGFELEFTASIANAESRQYGRFYNYVLKLMEESNIYNWRLDDDASCGNELVSPALPEEEGLAQTLQVCHCANTAQEKFNLTRIIGQDTGVHYHFDATDLMKMSNKNVSAIRNVLLLSAILEPLWYSMNPGARFDTAFAAPLTFNMFQMIRARDMTDIRDIWFRPYMGVMGHSDSYRVKTKNYMPSFINNDKQLPEKYDWTRYHGFNLNALFKHGTFEFRYTHGSFEPNNVEMWFYMYRQVVEASRTMPTRDIVQRCPININSIKMNCLTGMQNIFYADLKQLIQFLFKIIPQDIRMLKFVLTKIIKYNSGSMPANVILKIFDYQGDFKGLMKILEPVNIESSHYRRNRYKFMASDPAPGFNPDMELLQNVDGDEDSGEYAEGPGDNF